MIAFHGDATVIGTQGDRGKTTRRKSTKTVRGPEGRWIAQQKEELAKRPAGWLIKVEWMHSFPYERQAFRASVAGGGWYATEAEAHQAAASIKTGKASFSSGHNGDSYVARVWVEKEIKS